MDTRRRSRYLLESVHISHTHSNSTVNIFTDLTPLQLAVCEKDLKTVELVLEQGVDVNECHAGKKSALAIAASHSYEICAARGASRSDRPTDGLTAMHYLLRASKDEAAARHGRAGSSVSHREANDNLQNDILYTSKSRRIAP